VKTERAVTIIHALCKDNKHEDATSFLQWYISHLGRVESPTTNETKLQKKAEKLELEKNNITIENGTDIDVDSGWQAWSGGMCPIDDLNTKIEVVYRNRVRDKGQAGHFGWGDLNSPSNIIAYRVIKD
jgi:hypothetical protein